MSDAIKKAELLPCELREMFAYYPETGDLVWIKTKKTDQIGKQAGSMDSKGRLRVKIGSKSYGVHQVAFAMHHDKWPQHQIDHIDNQKANNRIENLREATNAQNSRNRRNGKPNASGYKGVIYHKGRYIARIMKDGVSLHLGCFPDPLTASAAYDQAALTLHEEFACTNS